MAPTKRDVTNFLRENLFTYETPKMVVVESRLVGILNRIFQLLLFVLVIIYIFIINNGYQYIDNGAVGGFTTKSKGIGYTNSSDERIDNRIWDSADLHIPPQDSTGFFAITNFIATPGQRLTSCENTDVPETKCTSDKDCKANGELYHKANGVSLGKCNTTIGYCILTMWCPVENDTLPENGKVAVVRGAKDFTVFIKNHVYFPYFEKGRSNLIETITKDSLKGCLYHPENDPYCPVFRYATIVGLAGRKTTTPDDEKDDEYFEQMAVHGGVISITVKWDCNFDYAESKCKPVYKFRRLDDLTTDVVSKGFNFRYSIPAPHEEDGPVKRRLVKAYGVMFLLKTEAVGRAFDLTTFLLNVGSGLGLLGIAAIMSDILLFNLHKHREYFKQFQSGSVVKASDRKKENNHQSNGNVADDYVCTHM